MRRARAGLTPVRNDNALQSVAEISIVFRFTVLILRWGTPFSKIISCPKSRLSRPFTIQLLHGSVFELA
jgi:hypothetical protein